MFSPPDVEEYGEDSIGEDEEYEEWDEVADESRNEVAEDTNHFEGIQCHGVYQDGDLLARSDELMRKGRVLCRIVVRSSGVVM